MYRNSGQRHEKVLLWGAPVSLWSGRVRSYLIKKGIEYQELYPANPRYQAEILPALGYFAVPVTELQDGTLIQDGTDTMECLEKIFPQRSMIPGSAVQRGVAWLIEFFGCDLFFIPAMHYRWNFPEQRANIDAEFARGISPHREVEKQKADLAPLQEFFGDFPRLMGINPDTIPAIEASHIECLEILNAHFRYHPYLLGGYPSVADFGLIGPMYAHLGRDPVPANLMKNIAPHVYRWTERMFEAALVDGEFPDMPSAFPENDEVPETLLPFLEYLFRDCGPQVLGMLETFNRWIESDPKPSSGDLAQRDQNAPVGAHPQLGAFDFELQGTVIHSQAFANVVYHFQRILEVIDGFEDSGKERFDALMARHGGTALMSTRLKGRIKSEDYALRLA
ncbi:MAG: glutathione S-transferase family protein [Pseudomonadota bacterium]